MRWEKLKMKWYEMICEKINNWMKNGVILSACKRWTWKSWHLIPRHWKCAEKQKSYVSDMKWMTDENDLWDEKTKCQVNTVRQSRKRRRLRRKGMIEEKGFKFFMKVRSRKSKRCEFEIERVVKKLSEGIRRSACRLFHRAGACW